jgi:hypothetical protein
MAFGQAEAVEREVTTPILRPEAWFVMQEGEWRDGGWIFEDRLLLLTVNAPSLEEAPEPGPHPFPPSFLGCDGNSLERAPIRVETHRAPTRPPWHRFWEEVVKFALLP